MSEEKRNFPYILVASLCVNAALAGAVIAGFVAISNAPQARGGPPPGGPDRGGLPFEERVARSTMEGLSFRERREFRKALSREWVNSRADRERVMKSRQRIVTLLSEETLDKSELEREFEAIRQAETTLKLRMHSRLVDVFEDIPAERRQELAKNFNSRRDHKGPPRHKGPGEGPKGNRLPPPRD